MGPYQGRVEGKKFRRLLPMTAPQAEASPRAAKGHAREACLSYKTPQNNPLCCRMDAHQTPASAHGILLTNTGNTMRNERG